MIGPVFFFIPLVFIIFLWLWFRSKTAWKKPRRPNETVVAFFHPNALCGGGGERVLWMMIHALQKRDQANAVRYVIYLSGPAPVSFFEASRKIKSQFNIQLKDPVEFIPVKKSHLIDGDRYRRFTMIRQAIGSIRLAFECLTRLCPDYYVDTTGFAFCYPLARLAGCKVMTYTHYPAISADMVSVVRAKTNAHNNQAVIAQSQWLTGIKIFYYGVFSLVYGLCGKCAHRVMVNSSWTWSHIQAIWSPKDIHIVFPPAPVEHLMNLPLGPRQNQIISVAQFRPEKRHDFQIRVFANVLERCRKERIKEEPRLVLVGGCRNKADEQYVRDLKELARQLGVQSHVVFAPNAPYEKLTAYLGSSKIGLHAMWNEHFGIGVVEYMAAGCIAVAHKSGGPALDILVPAHDGPRGFLADSMETYVAALCHILLGERPEKDLENIRIRGRKQCQKFSNDIFIKKIQRLMVFTGTSLCLFWPAPF